MNPDIVNGIYETAGAAFILFNCLKTYTAKEVKGVSIISTSFFTSWGLWNLYYYPALDQWFSFAGGCAIVLANCLWIGLMIEYTKGWRMIGWELVDLKRKGRDLVNGLYLASVDWRYARLWRDDIKRRRQMAKAEE